MLHHSSHNHNAMPNLSRPITTPTLLHNEYTSAAMLSPMTAYFEGRALSGSIPGLFPDRYHCYAAPKLASLLSCRKVLQPIGHGGGIRVGICRHPEYIPNSIRSFSRSWRPAVIIGPGLGHSGLVWAAVAREAGPFARVYREYSK